MSRGLGDVYKRQRTHTTTTTTTTNHNRSNKKGTNQSIMGFRGQKNMLTVWLFCYHLRTNIVTALLQIVKTNFAGRPPNMSPKIERLLYPKGAYRGQKATRGQQRRKSILCLPIAEARNCINFHDCVQFIKETQPKPGSLGHRKTSFPGAGSSLEQILY